jgi:hypothetical protein
MGVRVFKRVDVCVVTEELWFRKKWRICNDDKSIEFYDSFCYFFFHFINL